MALIYIGRSIIGRTRAFGIKGEGKFARVMNLTGREMALRAPVIYKGIKTGLKAGLTIAKLVQGDSHVQSITVNEFPIGQWERPNKWLLYVMGSKDRFGVILERRYWPCVEESVLEHIVTLEKAVKKMVTTDNGRETFMFIRMGLRNFRPYLERKLSQEFLNAPTPEEKQAKIDDVLKILQVLTERVNEEEAFEALAKNDPDRPAWHEEARQFEEPAEDIEANRQKNYYNLAIDGFLSFVNGYFDAKYPGPKYAIQLKDNVARDFPAPRVEE